MSALGLGRVCVEGSRFFYENGRASPQTLQVVPAGMSLEEFASQEMNRRFDEALAQSSCYCPFRPFVLQGNGTYHAGVIYQHWVADSVSMRMVLREWFDRVYQPARAREAPLVIPHGGYWHFFGPCAAVGTWATACSRRCAPAHDSVMPGGWRRIPANSNCDIRCIRCPTG